VPYLQGQAVKEEQPHGVKSMCNVGILVVAGEVSMPTG
jgi:hypothetical protein